MAARYQCFTHGIGWYWRLLGANNRVLARCADPFDNAGDAVRDARAVGLLAVHARIEVLTDTGSTWRWGLIDQGVLRAVSAGPYARRMECVRAVARFRGCAAVAPIQKEPMVFPPSTVRAQSLT
jgi:hypothetical protein